MTFNNCKGLVQLNIIHDEFLKNWKPLESIRTLPTNCVDNVFCFLGLNDRASSQQFSYDSETGEKLGQDSNYIIQTIQSLKREGIKINEAVYKLDHFFEVFTTKLYKNNITIVALIRPKSNSKDGMGHAVTIAKTNQGHLVLFDPQTQRGYFDYENIYNYINNKDNNFVCFSVYCEHNPLKRSRHNGSKNNIVRKKTRIGGRKNRQNSKKTKRKRQTSKNKPKRK